MAKRGKRVRSSRDPDEIEFARDQRKRSNEFADTIWQLIRRRQCRGQKFRREHPIPPYTVDFCCVAINLVIEIDGEHHYTEPGMEHDRKRDEYLRRLGYTVLRIKGYEVVRNTLSVKQRIESKIDELLPLE